MTSVRSFLNLVLFLTQIKNCPQNGVSFFAESLSIGDVDGETTRASLDNEDEFGYNLSADDESMFTRWAVKSLPSDNKKPVSVSVMLYLESLRDVSSDVTLDFYMIENWRDPRYIGMPSAEPKWRSPFNTVKLPGVTSEKFWYPDSYFYLVKSVTFDRNAQFMEIYDDGFVSFNRKVRIVIPCKPNVRMFPFDVTTCKLMMSSYAFTTKELLYEWNQQGIWQDEDAVDYIEDAGFMLLEIPVSNLTLNYSTGQAFSAITGDFKLKRKYLVYIVETFVPSALITALSWITFWISRTATPARASVGITTVLTMLTLGSGASNRYDKHISGSISAIDIYVWVCFSFVILSLLEFALADYWNQVETAAHAKYASRKASAISGAHNQQRGPFTRYLSKNLNENGSGIVHHNCSNCDPPDTRDVTATLLRNNNTHLDPSLEQSRGDSGFRARQMAGGGVGVNWALTSSPRQRHHSPNHESIHTHAPPTQHTVEHHAPPQQLKYNWATIAKRPPPKRSAKIDLMARWIFPTSFLIFNIMYWAIISWHLTHTPVA